MTFWPEEQNHASARTCCRIFLQIKPQVLYAVWASFSPTSTWRALLRFIITETERFMDYVAIWTDSFPVLCDSFHYVFVQGRWLGTIWAERRQAIRELAWVVVIGPWNLMAKWFLLTLVRWQEDLAASFVHQMGWNQGNQPQPFSLPRRWWGLARHRRGVAWRLQLGSWDNVVVEKVFFFLGTFSVVGQQENLSNCGYDFDFLQSLWDWWSWLTCYG